MTAEEANKIIALYMGVPEQYINGSIWSAEKGSTTTNFMSLDALVPVWEKLKGRAGVIDLSLYPNGEPKAVILNVLYGSIGVDAETIQEAACIATAKAIKELNNE